MNNIRTIFVDLPNTVGAYTIFSDDFYTIVLNQNLSHERNEESFLHELKHISNGDFDSDRSANVIEAHAHDEKN